MAGSMKTTSYSHYHGLAWYRHTQLDCMTSHFQPPYLYQTHLAKALKLQLLQGQQIWDALVSWCKDDLVFLHLLITAKNLIQVSRIGPEEHAILTRSLYCALNKKRKL